MAPIPLEISIKKHCGRRRNHHFEVEVEGEDIVEALHAAIRSIRPNVAKNAVQISFMKVDPKRRMSKVVSAESPISEATPKLRESIDDDNDAPLDGVGTSIKCKEGPSSFEFLFECRSGRLSYLEEKVEKQSAAMMSMRWEREVVTTRLAERDRLFENLAKACEVQWCWTSNNGDLHPYNVEANKQLKEAFRKWQVGDTTCDLLLTLGDFTYRFDFGAMIQTNINTGRKRAIIQRALDRQLCWDTLQNIQEHLLQVTSARAELDKQIDSEKRKRHECEKLLEDRTREASEQRDACNREMQMRHECEELLAGKSREVESALKQRDAYQMEVKGLGCQVAELERKNRGTQFKLATAQKELECTRNDMLKLSREAAELRDVVDRRNNELQEAERRIAESKRECSQALEFWKVTKAPRAHLLLEEEAGHGISSILKNLSHKDSFFQGTRSRCCSFQNHLIKKVQRVQNPLLWKKYAECKDALRIDHRSLGIKIASLEPMFEGLLPLLPETAKLDMDLNEVILVHGCSAIAARRIISEGFDVRHAGTSGGALYGYGLYFAQEPCKASQYTSNDSKTLIIARVALGHITYLTDGYDGWLPPYRNVSDHDQGRFDSIVINPNHTQKHREFVIFDGAQAYPEMLITYA